MTKMIVADDEPVISKGISNLVDWKSLGIEIVGVFEDGKSAMQGLLSFRPEIALLDISMPGMNGIDILKEIDGMQDIQTQIIFISGFQDFEYAKAALKYGASDYLLKPVIREELLTAVNKCLDNLRVKQNRPELQKTEGVSIQETDIYSKLIQIGETGYQPVYAEVIFSKHEDAQMQKLVRFSYVSFVEEYVESHKAGIVFVRNGEIIVILKGTDRRKAKIILNEIYNRAYELTGYKTAYILGKAVKEINQIQSAYEQCLKMKGYMFFAGQVKTPVFCVGEKIFIQNEDTTKLEEIRKSLVSAVAAQNKKVIQKIFPNLRQMVVTLADGKKEDAVYYYCSIVRAMEEHLTSIGLEKDKFDMKSLLEKGRRAPCFEEMAELYEAEIMEYCQLVEKNVMSSEKMDIARAKEYIENHYNENLSLNVLAKQIHMNPYYFSSFFKKHGGENFKDYLNKVRIRHAVTMLVSSNRKTYDIAMKVGFRDARVFAEVFSRYYGVTPSVYRKQMLQNTVKNENDKNIVDFV